MELKTIVLTLKKIYKLNIMLKSMNKMFLMGLFGKSIQYF